MTRLLAGWAVLVLLVALPLGRGPDAAGARPRVGVVALALWSDQGVFRSEATRAARLLSLRYGGGPTVVRSNSRQSFAAGPKGMLTAIRQAEKGLDPGRDVLVVVLTSHGSPQGIAEKGGGTEGLLAPAALGNILKESRVRRKALIVSACFSGIFTPLASPDLLVITAADADHPSFGCEAGANWTYFGRAFFLPIVLGLLLSFDQALRAGARAKAPLGDVFAQAAALVRAREIKEGFDPSNPQIAGGAEVLAALDGLR